MRLKMILGFTFIIIALTAIMFPCHADNTLTYEEAKTIIQKAIEFNDTMHWDDSLFSYEEKDTITIERTFYHYRGDLLGNHNLTINIQYHLITDESKLPGGAYENIEAYAKTIFTEDISEEMYSTSRTSYYCGDIPMFHIAEEGKIYMVSDVVAPEYVNWLDHRYDDVVDVIYSDDKRATVRYLINVGFDRDNPMWIECSMVKTDDGWRIAQSPFTDMLRYEWDASDIWEPYLIPYNPSTSDPAFDRIVLISTSPIACLVPAFYLLRRRRRNVI